MQACDRAAAISELAVSHESLDDRGVVRQGLVDVVRVGDELSPLLLRSAFLALIQDFLLGDEETTQLLGEEDVVDLDVMRREPVVQEGRREHHVVAIEPELDTILSVECVLITSPLEAAPGKNVHGDKEVYQKSGVVERATAQSEEARADGSHGSEYLEHTHPHIVDDAEGAMERMLRVLTWSHLHAAEQRTNRSASLREALIDNVLEVGGVSQQPALELVRH